MNIHFGIFSLFLTINLKDFYSILIFELSLTRDWNKGNVYPNQLNKKHQPQSFGTNPKSYFISKKSRKEITKNTKNNIIDFL